MTQSYSIPANVWAGFNFPVSVAGAIYFIGADGLTITVDPLNFYVNPTSKLFSINTGGDTTGTDSLNTYFQQDSFVVNSAQTAINTAPGMAAHTVSSCRGTGIAPANLASGDIVGIFAGWGYQTAGYTNLGGMAISTSGGTPSSLGGQIDFYTKANASTTFLKSWSIDNAGSLIPSAPTIQLGNPTYPLGVIYRLGVSDSTGGNRTINAPSGVFRILAGASSVVITNSYVDATTLVFATLRSSDTTAKSVVIVPSGGSFTATLNATATAAVDVCFFVVKYV